MACLRTFCLLVVLTTIVLLSDEVSSGKASSPTHFARGNINTNEAPKKFSSKQQNNEKLSSSSTEGEVSPSKSGKPLKMVTRQKRSTGNKPSSKNMDIGYDQTSENEINQKNEGETGRYKKPALIKPYPLHKLRKVESVKDSGKKGSLVNARDSVDDVVMRISQSEKFGKNKNLENIEAFEKTELPRSKQDKRLTQDIPMSAKPVSTSAKDSVPKSSESPSVDDSVDKLLDVLLKVANPKELVDQIEAKTKASVASKETEARDTTSNEGKYAKLSSHSESILEESEEAGEDELPFLKLEDLPASEDVPNARLQTKSSDKCKNQGINSNILKKSEIIGINLDLESIASVNVVRTERSQIENSKKVASGEILKFEDTLNYVSCLTSGMRSSAMIVGFQKLLEFHSPQYPEQYPNDSRCIYRYEVPADQTVVIKCPVYDLADGDVLTINGLEMPFNKTTGDVIPMNTKHDFVLEFSSDETGSAAGFICYITAFPSIEMQDDPKNLPGLTSDLDGH